MSFVAGIVIVNFFLFFFSFFVYLICFFLKQFTNFETGVKMILFGNQKRKEDCHGQSNFLFFNIFLFFNFLLFSCFVYLFICLLLHFYAEHPASGVHVLFYFFFFFFNIYNIY